MTAARAVFLDRDGVVNEAVVREGRPFPPATVDDLKIIPGVPDAVRRLRSAGFAVVIVTNQPDIARGVTSRAAVDAINDEVRKHMSIDDIRVCPHDDADRCSCRKPLPGLLTDAVAQHGFDVRESFMVGDRWRDIEAGRRAGCTTILVDYGYDEKVVVPDHRVSSLVEAADWILRPRTREGEQS